MTSTDVHRPAVLPYTLRLAIGGALLALMNLNVQAEDGKTAPSPSPDILLGPLFNDIQSAKLFVDQKTFADATPNSDPLTILADYRMQKNQASLDLRYFVELSFTLSRENDTHVPPKGQTLCQHIDGLWPVLTRNTVEAEKWDLLLSLPRPYVVPGGRFREVRYWDNYFTVLGLAESGYWDKVEDMIANFAAEINIWGHIPNGNRTYHLSRSQPPFFSFMVSLLATHDGDQVLKTYQPQLEKEYRYWMAGADVLAPGSTDKWAVWMADGALLNCYWDGNDTPRLEFWPDDVKTAKSNPNRPAIETCRDLHSAATSGWDFSSRWMGNPQQLAIIHTTSIVPVDLNVLMFHLEKTLTCVSKASGDSVGATQHDALASARQQATEKYLWNDKEGWYADYDLKTHKVRNQPTAVTLFPLYISAASCERVTKVAAVAESRLFKPGGLTTTTVNSGQQWDAPNGWVPLQWVAVEGLQNYSQQKIAMEVSWRFLSNVQHTYDSKQKLVEKYDVSSIRTDDDGGKYPLQDDFGWINGVILKILDLICPQEKPCDVLPTTCPAAAPSVQSKPAASDPAPVATQKTGA